MQSSLPYPATASSLAKIPEIEEMARLAVKKDMTSHITWHVLGIMARNRKDYNEASRAYGQARKIDPVSAAPSRRSF
jgi:peptide alpha-N-acetyltransferase